MKRVKIAVVALATTLSLAACTDPAMNDVAAGAAVGAVGGAIIADMTGGDALEGAIIGGAGGAIVGGGLNP